MNLAANNINLIHNNMNAFNCSSFHNFIINIATIQVIKQNFSFSKQSMSNTQISFEIYKWLSSLLIITSNQKYKSSGNIQLDSKIYDELISGQLMVKLVEKLAPQFKIQLNGPLLSSVKKSNTPAAKIYNWNILNDSFTRLGISLTKQMQKQITSGNFEQLKRFLIQIHRKCPIKKLQKPSQKQQFFPSQTVLNIKKLQTYQQYSQCQTIEQMIVLMISKNCQLTLKQAYSTLGQDLKYLAHMIVKGIKNSYHEIQKFFATLIANMPHAMYLCEKDPAKNTQFLLQIVKPTLISRDPDVALTGCRTLTAIMYQSLKYNQKNLIYQLLSQQSCGFDFLYMGLKRHPSISPQLNLFLHPLILHSYKQFYLLHLKSLCTTQTQYLKTITILLQGISSIDQSRQLVSQVGLVKDWVRMCQAVINGKDRKDNQEGKIFALELICDLWKVYQREMDQMEREDLLMKGIQELKKNTRKDNYVLKISALCRIFDFLDYLATQKNKLASIIYKKMIFLFVENHEDTQIRQVILQNFSVILQKFPTIPLDVLLQPLYKQLSSSQGSSYILNMFDFTFFIQLLRHPRLDASFALSFLQFFIRLYSTSIIYSQLTFRLIKLICSRYCQHQTIQQYIIKTIDTNLNVYGVLVLGKKKQYKDFNQAKQEKIINNQRRGLIVELIKFFVGLQNAKVNQQVKYKVSRLYANWQEDKSYRDNGLYSILTLFGDVDQIMMKYAINTEENTKSNHQNMKLTKPKQKPSSSLVGRQLTPVSALDQQVYSSRIKNINQFESRIVPSVNVKSKAKLAYDLSSSNMNQNQDFYKAFNDVALPKGINRSYNQSKSSKDLNLDPKTLSDIQLYRQKYQRQNQRRMLQSQIPVQTIAKINPTQLIQRQISLGFPKLFNSKPLTSQNMLFQFQSVKVKQLKDQTQLINLQDQQQRDIISKDKVIQRYDKYIKALFFKYNGMGSVVNRIKGQDNVTIPFIDLMRMLKDKNLNKLPKIIVNQLITHINRNRKFSQTNLLAGVHQQDFNHFLVLFTNLYTKAEGFTKDVPFGFKIQQVLMRLFQGQPFARQLFDKKSQQWYNDNQIAYLTEQQQINVSIPEGYKRIVNDEVVLNYKVNAAKFNLSESYQDCIEILNWLMSKAVQINIFPAITQTKQVTRIVPLVKIVKPKIPQNLTQKSLKRSFAVQQSMVEQIPANLIKEIKQKLNPTSSFRNPVMSRSKSQKQNLNKTQISEQQKQKKRLKHQQHAQKLRQQLQILRAQKTKKNEQQQQKKQQQELKQQKKQQAKKKYLQQIKKKNHENKQKVLLQQHQKQQQQKQQKQNQKQILKQKQKQQLLKQKQKIKQKQQKYEQKQKSQQKKIEKQQKIEKKVQNVLVQHKNKALTQKEKDNHLNLIFQDQKSHINVLFKQYQKEIKILYQQYWNWKTKKIQLQAIALMMKNFNISPQYLAPKIIVDTYKQFSKGEALQLVQFKQLLARLSFRSQKLLQQVQSQSIQFNPIIVSKLLSQKLHMKDINYQQTIKAAKLQQL